MQAEACAPELAVAQVVVAFAAPVVVQVVVAFAAPVVAHAVARTVAHVAVKADIQIVAQKCLALTVRALCAGQAHELQTNHFAVDSPM